MRRIVQVLVAVVVSLAGLLAVTLPAAAAPPPDSTKPFPINIGGCYPDSQLAEYSYCWSGQGVGQFVFTPTGTWVQRINLTSTYKYYRYGQFLHQDTENIRTYDLTRANYGSQVWRYDAEGVSTFEGTTCRYSYAFISTNSYELRHEADSLECAP